MNEHTHSPFSEFTNVSGFELHAFEVNPNRYEVWLGEHTLNTSVWLATGHTANVAKVNARIALRILARALQGDTESIRVE